MMKRIELLAPGGDIASIKSAILAGADAVYCGLNRFNARNRAENITFDDLDGILALAHKNECEVFLTVNVLIVESEWPAFINLLNKLANTEIDGVIVQDLGALHILKRYFKPLKVHASTQMTTHNRGQIAFLRQLSATRVNLCRELSLDEVRSLTTVAHEVDMETEVFVHGAHCISFSGLCYLSSVQGGNSGNRGRCSQPCRSEYALTPQGKHFPLNLKDNSAFDDLTELAAAGVDSLKIEGRIKNFDYVYSVTQAWRSHLNNFYNGYENETDKSALHTVFNRGLSNAFLTGSMGEDLFTDNPRDNSARALAEKWGDITKKGVDAARDHINAERAATMADVQARIDQWVLHRGSVNNRKKRIKDVQLPRLNHQKLADMKPALSILIAAESDLNFCESTDADIYFQLPSSLGGRRDDFLRVFRENPRIIPWVPAILIDEELESIVCFLEEIKAQVVVINNSGVAMEAFQRGISWIAGPYLNAVNSYSLKCLKEEFGCSGAFVSSELSRNQIGAIKSPADFKLFYSLFQPMVLMTSRTCLFLSVTGCAKSVVDRDCLQECAKVASITNKQGEDLLLEKSRGNYHRIYNDSHFLNLDIVTDMPGRFDNFLIDLRNINTKTRLSVDKPALISLFEQSLRIDESAIAKLKDVITPWINTPYKKGI